MEGLVLVILDAVFAVFVEVAIAVFSVLVSLFFSLLGMLVRLWNGRHPEAPRFRVSPVFARRLRRVLLGFTAAVGLALILAQTVFFQPLVRRLCAAAKERTGIEVDFSRASGNLLAGRVTLHETALKRTSSPSANFDLTVKELEIDVRLLRLLTGTVSLQSARASGLRGSYSKLSGPEQPPRKPFQSDVLLVEDAELSYTVQRADRPPFTAPLRVDRLEARPFEAQNAAFSILFRSNAAGSIAGAPFAITGEGDGEGRRTHWTADRVPVAFLADFLGPPFDWVREGTASVSVHDAWKRGPPLEVDLAWKVVLHDPRAAVPERITGLPRRVAESVVAFINRKPREIPLAFVLTLDGNGFMGRMSPEGLALWDAVADTLVVELAEASGLPPDVLRDWGRAGLQKLKGFLRRKAAH